MDRAELNVKLRRHRQLFDRLMASGRVPTKWNFLWHEIRTHRGRNLIWAAMLRIPWIGERLKRSLATSLVCPFIGFDSDTEEGVGCMLHPSRQSGHDIRNATAFRLLPGINCGDSNYVCQGSHRYDGLSRPQQMAFETAVGSMDWFDYTNTVRAFCCGYAGHDTASAGDSGNLLPILPDSQNHAA